MRIVAAALVLSIGCAAAAVTPAEVRLNADTCTHCRMTVVSIRTAAQIVSPGEEPLIFDELGCLRDYLAAHSLPADAHIFVADHRTGAWVSASSAIFTRTSLSTPMSSGLIAHADVASRDADADARDGEPVDTASVIQPARVTP
jgi:copper chaperone NosL